MRLVCSLFALLLVVLPLRAEWEELPPLPTPRDQMAQVVIGTTAFFIGGNATHNDVSAPTDDVLRFDLETREWLDPAPSLLFPRIGAAAVEFDGKIYVIGGRTTGDTLVPQIEAWWPGRNFWEIVGNLVPRREGARAVVMGDTAIAVLGGYTGNDTFLGDVVLVVPDSLGLNVDVSGSLTPLPSARASIGASVLDDHICIFGGFYFGPLGDRYRYENGGWASLETLPFALAGMGVATVFGESGSAAVISGGFTQDGETDTVMVMMGNGTLISFGDNLPFARANHSMVAADVGENTLLIAGGSYEGLTGDRILIDDVIIYPPLQDAGTVERDRVSLPREFSVSAYPNPFNGPVSIVVNALNEHAPVSVRLFDVLGREVTHWARSGGGRMVLSWDGSSGVGSAPSGVYFIIAEQNGRRSSGKLVRLP